MTHARDSIIIGVIVRYCKFYSFNHIYHHSNKFEPNQVWIFSICIIARHMSKEQFLKFGQIIRIHGHHLAEEMEGQRGMIVAKGFTDSDAKYMTFETFRKCEFYRQSLFQVLPKGIFEVSNSLPTGEEKNKLHEGYKALITEKMGSIIKFGEDVVFKHVDSQEYLSGSVRCSEGGLGAFKIELNHQLQKNLVFKMYPFRSFEKQGDSIKLQSPLRIKNMENRCYISTQKNRSSSEKQRKKVQYNIVTTYSQSYTWLFHLHESQSMLTDTDQIRTHDIILLTYTKNEGYLCLDQVKKEPLRAMVRLPLQETGYPCYTCLWEIEKQLIPEILPFPDKKRGTEGTYTLRQILTGEYLKVLPFQKQNIRSGVVANIINTTKLDEEEVTIKSAKGMSNSADFIKHNGLVKISGPKQVSLIRNGGEIDVQDTPVRQHENFNFREKQPDELREVTYLSGDGEHGFRVEKIDEESKQEVLFIISTYEVLDEFAKELEWDTLEFEREIRAKRLEFIDELLKKLIAFIKDCSMEELEEDTLPNKKKQYIAKDLKICDKLFKILGEMGSKLLVEIYKKEKPENDAFKKLYNRAYYLILQIIKCNPITKLYVCEDWLNIILNHAIENEEEGVHDTLYEILQSNELVVAKFLQANNCHLMARIINVFSLKPPHEKFLNIFRASCISNGSPIVKNQNLVLEYFFQKLSSEASFTFIMPRAQASNMQNQLQLRCSISKDPNRVRTFKDFFDESSRLDLSQTSNYFIAYLNLLADICYGRNTEAKKYVEKSLSPEIYDLETRRSGETYDALYTLNYILQDKDIEKVRGYKNLLRAVIRVINYAFVESADQNPVLRINRYRNIDMIVQQHSNVEDKGEVRTNGNKFKKLESVMNFVKYKIENFRSFYEQPILEYDFKKEDKMGELDKLERAEMVKRKRKEQEINSIQDKQFLLTELILLKSTLIIGYWTVQEQQKLLPILLKVLMNSKRNIMHFKENIPPQREKEQAEFKLFKEEARRSTPTVELITSCKALVCELIEIIFDFRHDDLVTKCVAIYKEMNSNVQTQVFMHNIVINESLNIDHKDDSRGHGPDLYNVKVWKHKLANIFDEGKESAEQSTNKKMVPLMVQLGIHQNPTLFFRSLLIMKRFFEYRNEILDLFLNLSLYDSESGEYLSGEITKKRKELNTLEEENLLYTDQKGVYDNIMGLLVWLSEAIKVDFQLEDRPNFKRYNCIFHHYHEKSQINQFRQRTIKNMDLHPVLLKFIGLSRQSLKTYSEDARNVLKYVYRFLSLLCKGFIEAKLEIYQTEGTIDIIKKHIKEEVHLLQQCDIPAYKSNSLQTLKRRDDCQAIQLLSELFSHNKTILYNESVIEKTCEEICEMVNDLNLNNYYKSHLLDFFRSLIYFRDQKVTINQSRILAKLQDPKKQRIFYRTLQPTDQASENLIQEIIRLLQQFADHNPLLAEIKELGAKVHHSQPEERDLLIGPELTYFITLFNLFANLVEGKHVVNIGKGRQVHSYEMLMKILKHADLCYPLKTTVRNYINQLYYSTPIEEDLYNQIIKEEMPLMISDLNVLITILIKDIPTMYLIAHPVRYRYYETYIFLYIQQILLSLHYLFCDSQSQFFRTELQKQLTTNYSRGYYYLHYFIIRIYERLRWLTERYYKHHYVRGLLNLISNRIKVTFLEDFKKTAFRIFDRDEEKKHEPAAYSLTLFQEKEQITQRRQQQLMKRCNMYLHKLVKGEIGNFYEKNRNEKDMNFPLTFTLPYEEKNSEDYMAKIEKREKQTESLAQKLKIMFFPNISESRIKTDHYLRLQTLSEELMGSVSFQNFLDSYTIKNCKQLYRIDEYSKDHYDFLTPFIDFSEYIKIFVQVNNQKPESIPNNLRIFFFKLILFYIKQERQDFVIANPLIPNDEKDLEIAKEILKWSKEDWKDVEAKVQENQEFLVQAQVAELIIQSLKNAEDLHLYAAIFKFCIAYLLGGNTQGQYSIYLKLKEDEKNNVFIKIERLIERLGKRITSRIAEKTNRKIPEEDEFIVEALDQYDYYDPAIKGMKKFQSMSLSKKDEEAEEELENDLFSMIFKFLQLLCECNNIDMKNFVREQINMNDEKKSYSFNLINVAIFEIRRLFKVMNKDASLLISSLIDFVNQVVAVPCLQNQRSLCETTFFDDLCYMASFFSERVNLRERGFDNVKSFEFLNNVYKQCILIILNVLESNDQSLIKQLLMKIRAKFLFDIIIKNLETCGIHSKEQLLGIIDRELLTEPKVPPKIEQAMNVIIVIEKLETSEGSERFKEQKEAYLTEIKKNEEKNIDLKELLKTLREQMLKIEIVSQYSKKKQFIYFPNHPILKTLSPTTRDRIMLEVARSTQRQKIRSLFSFRVEIIQEIRHNFELQKYKLLGVIPYKPAYILMMQNWAFKLSFMINLIWFLSSEIIVEYFEVTYYSPYPYNLLLEVMDMTQLAITLLFFLSYYKCQYALAAFRANKHEEEKKEKQTEKTKDENEQMPSPTKSNNFFSMQTLQGPLSIIKTITLFLLCLLKDSSLGILFRFDPKFAYVFFYLLVSVTGTFYSQSAFLCYILFFFMKNDTLSNVFNAIVYNLGQLVSVGMLGLVFVYVFCLIFYETYALEIMSEAGDEACDSIISCILDLYVSGTIGGSVEKFQFMRFLTDLVYFIFFGLLFGNIVSGIMINTFAELRTQRDQMNDDKKNKCYICGRDRAMLEKNNENFDQHITERHFLWNYIFYTYCLETKHETQYSGLEYEISNCLENKHGNEENANVWIPFNSEEEDSPTTKINELEERVVNLTEKMKKKIEGLKSQQLNLDSQAILGDTESDN